MDPLRQIQGSEIFLGNFFTGNSTENHKKDIHPDHGNNDGNECNNVKKRNRISFVCQACRRSKTKCDREKPRCGRCTGHGIPCIYDVEKQVAPRNPSKDATIARLEKDVDYWRDKAMKSMQEEGKVARQRREQKVICEEVEFPSRPSKRPFSIGDGSGSPLSTLGTGDSHETPLLKTSRPNISSSTSSSLSASRSSYSSSVQYSTDQIRINLYNSHPSMIMNSTSKREVQPLSENYVITQDMFLSGLLSSVFLDRSSNTMLPALSASAAISKAQPSVTKNINELKNVLANHCRTSLQLKRLHGFTDRILNNISAKEILPIGRMGLMLQSAFQGHYLENHCPPQTEYSDTLKSFITEVEELLPPYFVIQNYKSHFYKNVFPNIPFLDEKSFEDSLQSTLFPHDSDPQRVVIRLGNVKLRHKMENLCILLLVLKLSYISLEMMNEEPHTLNLHQRGNLEKYPISNQTIILTQKILATENFFRRANENIITCLLCIWCFFVYSPEEGDFFLDHPTDLILGIILPLSMSIGLHRDPSDFPQLRDSFMNEPSIMNHRRILWVSVVTAICLETSLKGRHPVTSEYLMRLFVDIKSPDALQFYMERVKNDMPLNANPELLQQHEFAFKRLLLSLLILDLVNITLTYNSTFSLNSIEEARNKIVQFLDENFPMPNFDRNTEETKDKSGVFVESNALPMRIIGFLMILRSSLALFLHFESLLPENPEYMPQYRRYFNQVCLDTFTLILYPRTFFVNIHKFKSSPAGSYNVTKCIQMGLSTSLLALFAIFMRADLASQMLFARGQEAMLNANDESMKVNNQKLEILDTLKKLLESTIENIHGAVSEHLRFTYFSVFKMLALFDVIVLRMKKSELWGGVFKMEDLGNFNTAFLKALNMRLSLDPDDRQSMVEKLKQRTYVMEFPPSELTSLYQRVKMKYDDLPPGCAPVYHHLNPSKSPLGTLFKLYEGNYSMKNLDKLSSVVTLSQNSNPGSFYDPTQADPRIKTEIPDFATIATPELELSDDNYTTVTRDFPGIFGGLDLFNYDFLFGNDL